MKHFFVVAREDKKEILEFVQKLTDYIEKKGGTCSYGINPDDALEAELDVPEDTQGILVAGGDVIICSNDGYFHIPLNNSPA